MWKSDPNIGYTGDVDAFNKAYEEKREKDRKKRVAKLKKQQDEYYEELTNRTLEKVSWF